jgi:alkylated DNA repair dioxygenase AlkB
MPRHSSALSDQDSLFGSDSHVVPRPALPAGFAYRDGLVSPEEERELVGHFETLPFKPFEFYGFLGKRQVISFGWRYDFAGRALKDSDPIPSFLLPLRQKAADFAGAPAESLEQVLINEYRPGAGIGWHRDRPMFEDVIAVSLLAPCILRFRRKEGAEWERASRGIEARSVYLLHGPVRREWEHSIPPVDQLRYSVTFRNFVATAPTFRKSRPAG